eukprot:7384726-Prymnesium_polylepis.2
MRAGSALMWPSYPAQQIRHWWPPGGASSRRDIGVDASVELRRTPVEARVELVVADDPRVRRRDGAQLVRVASHLFGRLVQVLHADDHVRERIA